MRVMRGEEDGIVPLEPEPEGVGAGARRVIGPDVDRPALAGAMIEPAEIAIVISAINDIRIERVGDDIPAFIACRRFPVPFGDPRACRPALDPQTGIVLLRSKDMIGEGIVRGHPVYLGRGLIVHRAPVSPSIIA